MIQKSSTLTMIAFSPLNATTPQEEIEDSKNSHEIPQISEKRLECRRATKKKICWSLRRLTANRTREHRRKRASGLNG